MFAQLKYSVMAWSKGPMALRSQWLVHEHEHWFQMNRVYKLYGVDNLKALLNASIDHERRYGKLPHYFKQNDGLDWLVHYYEHLEPDFQMRTHPAFAEMTGVYVAHSVGKSNRGYLRQEMGWSDVVGELLSGHMAFTTHTRLLNKIKDIHGQEVANRMG